MTIRPASHAGSWYSSNPRTLSRELDNWLSLVPSSNNSELSPTSSARIIIAPSHAGYAYSGPAAAYAYATLSLTSATRRIFLLGPSHTLYLTRCALTTHSGYKTPAGILPIDTSIVATLHATGKFDNMAPEVDEREHSLEMHLPFIYKLVSRSFESQSNYPSLVPILVGNTTAAAERDYARILASYLADTSNVFIISSDFCHWGSRFDYTYYLPESRENHGYDLSRHDPNPNHPLIHESISKLDHLAMDAIESGSHSAFLKILKETGNTVCGRHPIGIALAMMEILDKENWKEISDKAEGASLKAPESTQMMKQKRNFKFVRYERSSDIVDVSDSSVSYASAYAII